MRQNKFVLIFILVLVLLGAGAFGFRRLNSEREASLVRIAFKANVPIREYDPTSIQVDTQALLLDQLYSPLVRFSANGDIEPALAEKFWLDGNVLHFVIRKDLKTVDGHSVSIDDALFSFKRVLIADTIARKQLQQFVCSRVVLNGVGDSCGDIQIQDDQLVFKAVDATHASFLLKLLAGMSFGVVPRSSCDHSSPLPKIVDYRNTSGPYYLAKDDSAGAFVLQANPGHWLYSSGLMKTVEIRPALADEALDLLEQGKVDYISGLDVNPSQHLARLRKDSDLNFFDTYPIKKLLIATTFDQLKDFSPQERLALYAKVREAYCKSADSVGWHPTLDFFPSLGEGSLTRDQLTELEAQDSAARKIRLHRPVTLGVGKARMGIFQEILKDEPDIRLVEIKKSSSFVPLSERPDFYITGTDSSFYESISLISYDAGVELMDLREPKPSVWIERFIEAADKGNRTAMLRELNLRTLELGLMGVIGESPYTEVSRKPFFNLGAKFVSGSPFWLIRRN